MDTLNREALGLIPWLTSSWLLFLLGALLSWFSGRWGRPARSLRRFLLAEGALLAPGDVLAFLYAVGLPYLAIVWGFLDPVLAGLSGFAWWETLGQGALLGAGLLLAAGLAWGLYLGLGRPPATLLLRSRRLWAVPPGRLLFLPWAAAEEAHWAFYRALPVLLWGLPGGLWAGVLLLVAEHYAVPQATAHLGRPGGIEEEAWWLTKVVAMTAAFAVLGNWWLCVVLHALLEGLVAWLVQRRLAAPDAARAGPPSASEPWRSPAGGCAHGRRAHPALLALVLAPGAFLSLLAIMTWQAVRPTGPPRPAAATSRPTAMVVPTPTPTATPRPTQTASPTPLPIPTATATPGPTPQRTYVVQPGDTLKDIAAHFRVSVADLMQANDIVDADRLQVGQVLVIP